ncbi:DUF6602 domain-containing protein [Beijerinckia mobilis]|uniref:DUF6602 domain-containing protein n=1 Tax=Beijerinckia mobilis TaxID=231434 RepID=UPI0006919A1F|nr:DUF6602 domain-containing protein [Beijerinckia mobilis]
MEAPTFKPNDFCICLDDPWTAVRSLAVEKIQGDRVTVRRDGLPIYPVETEVIAADRLVYNPYRNAAHRAFTNTNATVEQQRQLDQAVLVRVVTANITADRQAAELTDLKQRIAALLPELSADFIDVCLRAMTVSSALRVEPAKKGKIAPKKIKLFASEDMLRSEQSSAFAYSFADDLSNQSRRFGRLVVHRGTAGGYREELLRALLRRTLAERYHVATGFIDGCDLQLDIIIYDRIDYAPLFRQGDLVVVPMDSVRAVLEVKTRLTTGTLKESLEHLDSLPFEIAAPIFKGIFAFETDIPDRKLLGHVAKFYEDSMTIWGQPFDEVTAICVLERQLVLSGYADNPTRPVLSLMRNLMGRNFQAAVFLDTMQNYLRTPAPRVLPDGLTWRSRVELGATSRDYLTGMWQVMMEDTDSDEEGGARDRALARIARTVRWLENDDPW